MSSAAAAGQAAAVLGVLQVIPYIGGIMRGQTRPQRTTYAIWATVDTVAAASYGAAGARASLWLPIAFAATGWLIFVLSLRYGVGGRNRLDLICLALAGVAIWLWLATNDPRIPLYTSVIAAVLGALPTIRKSYLRPDTENQLSWTLSVAGSTLNLLALTSLRFDIALLPITSFILDTTISALILLPRLRIPGLVGSRPW